MINLRLPTVCLTLACLCVSCRLPSTFRGACGEYHWDDCGWILTDAQRDNILREYARTDERQKPPDGSRPANARAPDRAEEFRNAFDSLLQRSLPGWARTQPIVFEKLFHDLHANKAVEWRDAWMDGPAQHARAAAEKRDRDAFHQTFPLGDKHGYYDLSLDTSGTAPRIAWQHRQAAPRQPELPFKVRLENQWGREVPATAASMVDDGWLVSHNDGEFGAWLYWYSPDGKARYDVAANAWVNRFFPFAGRLFAICGLSHMSSDSGEVLELANVGGRWQAVRRIALAQEARLAAPLTETSFLVLCTATLAEVSLDGTVRYRFGLINTGLPDTWPPSVFWFFSNPSSMLVHAGKIWVGTSFGVVIITLGGAWQANVEWLVPGEPFANIERQFKLFPRRRIPAPDGPQAEQRKATP